MITDEQHLTVCEDIHVDDNMGNEDKALDIIIPDLNSAMTVKDINGDQDIMTDEQHLTVCEGIHVDDIMDNEDKTLDITIPDLNTSIAIKNVNGDHDNVSGKLKT
ncbi:uncharacterized protein LOC111041932 [Myzus persicae]|uniref:uncharacterized protein LOC111041932 n=1 Tax=Myzus persicae TaxID=13164 RepID=UPI000B938629|nr:uncharacterized protein LOC111041932 [Myzus persicae]